MFLLYHNDILRKSIFYKFQNKTYISNEIQVSVLPRGNTKSTSITILTTWIIFIYLNYFLPNHFDLYFKTRANLLIGMFFKCFAIF